jgi:hypothetical protein
VQLLFSEWACCSLLGDEGAFDCGHIVDERVCEVAEDAVSEEVCQLLYLLLNDDALCDGLFTR